MAFDALLSDYREASDEWLLTIIAGDDPTDVLARIEVLRASFTDYAQSNPIPEEHRAQVALLIGGTGW